MAGWTMALFTLVLLPAAILAAPASAPAPDPLAGVLETALAPGFRALEANPPLKAAFLSTPYVDEFVAYPKTAASAPDAVLLFEDPQVVQAINSLPKNLDPLTTDQLFYKALPPQVTQVFEVTAATPVTGNPQADVNTAEAEFERVPGGTAAVLAGFKPASGGRKMLQA